MSDAATSRDLLARAVGLRNAGHDMDAYLAFLDLGERFAGSTDAAVRLDVAEATLNVGVFAMRMAQPLQAIALFDKIVREYPEAAESVAAALTNKIRVLMTGPDLEEALRSCGELVRRFGDATDPWTVNCVAGALSNQGLILWRQRRFEEAIAPLDEVCVRFGNSTDATLLHHVAMALYNKSMALRDAGRLAEAVATFTETVERFAQSASPDSRRLAAMALYNRAITLARLGDLAGSAGSAEEMERRFGDSADAAIRERLAKALYNRALILRHQGLAKEAAFAFAAVAGNFLLDKGQVIEAVVAAARRRAILMALIMDGPAGHRANNIFTQTEFRLMEDEALAAPRERAEIRRREIEHYRQLIGDLVEQDEKRHLQAASILVRYLDHGEPFGLFLRNFDIEGSLREGTLEGQPERINVQIGGENVVETQLAEACRERVPLLGINNNVPTLPRGHDIPMLEVSNEKWKDIVEELTRAAAMVVVQLQHFTPGVLAELDMLARLGKTMQTVVLISEPDEVMSALPQVLIKARPPASPADLDDEALAKFPFKFRVSNRDERSLEDWPLFDVLLERIERTYQQEKAERKSWDGVAF